MTAGNPYLPGTIVIPSSLVITAITQSYPMVVTAIVDPVTASNSYQAGQLVRLNVPYSYGMFQANGLVGQIMQVDGLVFTLDLNSSMFDPFVIPNNGEIPASLSPAGSRNLQYDNFTRNVPFQSLNNRGN